MAPINKIHFLSLNQKIEILRKLSRGVSVKTLTEQYGVNKSTISRIKKSEPRLKDFLVNTESGPGKRRTLRSAELPKMEKALFDWFIKKRANNVPISTEILCEKARFFHEKIKESPGEFSASRGWVQKFKNRHGIRILKVTGEKLSNKPELVAPFLEKFNEKVREHDLMPEQIYNADESGLFWKLLPQKTLVHLKETSAPGRKTSKQRITFLTGANATGSHKLKPFIIGKSKNPRVFKNFNYKEYVTYASSQNAWMTFNLFEEWMAKSFVPEVSSFLRSQGLPQRVLLLLDNAPCHPQDCVRELHGLTIIIMCLPANCTAILQPMDQNAINLTKLFYKRSLLMHIVASDEFEKALQGITLKMAVFFLSKAWQDVSSLVIKNCWKKIMQPSEQWDMEDEIPLNELRTQIISERNSTIEPLRNILQVISEGEAFSNDDIAQWISEENVCVSESTQCISDEESEEVQETGYIKPKVKLEDAIRSIGIVMEWAEQNEVSSEEIMVLHKLREKAISNRFGPSIQTKIVNYFPKI